MVGMGDLRYRATVQSPVETDDVLGGHARVWTTVATVWMALTDALGSRWTGVALQDGTTHVVTLRPLAGLKPGWSVVYGGRRFMVQQVVKRSLRLWDVTCVEGELD